jgi:hypothetical protein
MAYETIVAVYDTAAHAEAAVKALKAGGIADANISIFDDDPYGQKIETAARTGGYPQVT